MGVHFLTLMRSNKWVYQVFGGQWPAVTHGTSTRKMQTFLVLAALLLISGSGVDAKKTPAKCSICKDIVNNFHKGLSSTQKSNYGGGNTKWEEKSLGSYATSEVRLVEIVEKLCDEGAKECHSVLEEHEELVERYWFKEFAQKKDTDLYRYLCIEHMKVCCPNNTYGKDCTQCPGTVDRPCSGNGQCDGDGTRSGSGKCKCHSGYNGELCNKCKDGFYEEYSNETHTSCKVCDLSCKNTCSEGGPKGCDQCKDGWLENEEVGCQDINECLEDPCDEDQYCLNTRGSFTCFSCDVACESCTGSGPDKCKECGSGFSMDEKTNTCIDNNECETNAELCKGEHEVCKNTPGSYECGCVTGFARKEDACVRAPKEKVSSSKKFEDPLNLAEQLKKNNSKRKDINWEKFKGTPGVAGHFLVMALYGISCRFATFSNLAMFALSLLMVIHVVWFASNSH